MKILSAVQMRAWDAYTIKNEPIASVDLMNRAADTFVDWFVRCYPVNTRPVVVCCGTGNNGGDGVAIARLLHGFGFGAKVVVCDFAGKQSDDFQAQIHWLTQQGHVLQEWIHAPPDFPDIPDNAILIDALFGTGLSRPLTGEWAQLIARINHSGAEIVSVDLPSGLVPDGHTMGDAVICARRTFAFERPKLAFFFPENAERVGDWAYGSIGLDSAYEKSTDTIFQFLTSCEVASMVLPRSKFAHKGSFGHALLIAGSFGKMGAAVLSAQACLRSGVGLLTVHAPRCGNLVLQISVPEAMSSPGHRAQFWAEVPDLQAYASIGVGPGIGNAPETWLAFRQLLENWRRPMVIDADALNLLSTHPEGLRLLPPNSILTPHPKEFERLFGKTGNDFQRNELQREKARELGVFILLKGAHSCIACPDGACWFNTTGNPGMATGGSGDVLTGLLTGLLAQGYPPQTALLLGVYLHGLAGDLAAQEMGQAALIAGDLVRNMGQAWQLAAQHRTATER